MESRKSSTSLLSRSPLSRLLHFRRRVSRRANSLYLYKFSIWITFNDITTQFATDARVDTYILVTLGAVDAPPSRGMVNEPGIMRISSYDC